LEVANQQKEPSLRNRLVRSILIITLAIGVFCFGMLAATREMAPYRWVVIAYQNLLPQLREAKALI
jgi:hypothetical protein